jgi:hypothetical protein
MPEINIDEIMQQIRAEIKEKGLDSSMLSFDDVPFERETGHTETTFSLPSLTQSAEYLNVRNQIEPYKPIDGNPIVVFVKKVIRKLMKFYIMPVVTEQNALNYHCSNAVSQVSAYMNRNAGVDIVALAAEVEELKLIQAGNKKEIAALRERVDLLTAENDALRQRR